MLAQADGMDFLAKQGIQIISTEDRIEITSPKEIVITAGGSQIKLDGSGIFPVTGGKFEVKAGQHLFTGGAKVSMKLPHLPVIQEGGFSQLFDLKDLSKDLLSKRLAYYMAEFNVLHPFREGNGRTIREFIRQLAYVNGYIFNLQNIKELY